MTLLDFDPWFESETEAEAEFAEGGKMALKELARSHWRYQQDLGFVVRREDGTIWLTPAGMNVSLVEWAREQYPFLFKWRQRSEVG